LIRRGALSLCRNTRDTPVGLLFTYIFVSHAWTASHALHRRETGVVAEQRMGRKPPLHNAVRGAAHAERVVAASRAARAADVPPREEETRFAPLVADRRPNRIPEPTCAAFPRTGRIKETLDGRRVERGRAGACRRRRRQVSSPRSGAPQTRACTSDAPALGIDTSSTRSMAMAR
jgi:hypothetical protein